MKHRTLLMFALALMQTCITLAAEPFTRNQYEEMVRLFNGHQQTDTKHPFDKWTSLPLPGKSKGLEDRKSTRLNHHTLRESAFAG